MEWHNGKGWRETENAGGARASGRVIYSETMMCVCSNMEKETRKRASSSSCNELGILWNVLLGPCYHSRVICDLYHHLMMPNNSFVVSFSLCVVYLLEKRGREKEIVDETWASENEPTETDHRNVIDYIANACIGCTRFSVSRCVCVFESVSWYWH